MAHPESKMRRKVLETLEAWRFHAKAIENGMCSPGTPDVTYCGWASLPILNPPIRIKAEGMLELKCLPEWPKRASTHVKVHEFTKNQRDWLTDRWEAGGATSLLLRVGEPRLKCDWLLFAGPVAARYLDYSTRARLLEVALVHYNGFAGPWLSMALGQLSYNMANEHGND